MKRFTLILFCLTLIFNFASLASACNHVATAGGYCANCAAQYNQSVGAVSSYGVIPTANAYTRTTVTETVTQPATSGLQVSAEYVQPQTTLLAPAPAPVVAATPPGYVVGAYQPSAILATPSYSSYGTFGAGGYGSYGSFGSFRNGYSNSFGVVNVGYRNFGNRNFGAFNGHRNFSTRSFSGNPVVVINANRSFNAHGQQVNAGGRVQALPRLSNAINALRGK